MENYNSKTGKHLIQILMFSMYNDQRIIYREYIQNAYDAINRAVKEGILSQMKDGIVGFATCGNAFGVKTVYTSILLPVFLGILERAFPNYQSLTDSPELDVICYILVVSVGLSILFNRNASSGGLDIVAKMLNKYLHIDLGKAMSVSGMIIALSSALVYDSKTVVLSILGTYFNGIVLDYFIFGQSVKRRVCIITREEEKLRAFILRELHSGATVYEALGAYTLKPQREIIAIVDKNEYQKLMQFINQLDPDAFITVYTVSSMRYRPKV